MAYPGYEYDSKADPSEKERNSPNRKTGVAKAAKALTRSKISISISGGFMPSPHKSAG